MRALLTVMAIIMIVALLCATYMALGDFMNPLKEKVPVLILWLIFFVPTVVLVHLAFFRRSGKDESR